MPLRLKTKFANAKYINNHNNNIGNNRKKNKLLTYLHGLQLEREQMSFLHGENQKYLIIL